MAEFLMENVMSSELTCKLWRCHAFSAVLYNNLMKWTHNNPGQFPTASLFLSVNFFSNNAPAGPVGGVGGELVCGGGAGPWGGGGWGWGWAVLNHQLWWGRGSLIYSVCQFPQCNPTANFRVLMSCYLVKADLIIDVHSQLCKGHGGQCGGTGQRPGRWEWLPKKCHHGLRCLAKLQISYWVRPDGASILFKAGFL